MKETCCKVDSSGGDDDSGDGESQECKDARAITHKDEQSDNDAGTYVSQCYDLNMNSDSDVTKWTFKKGTGSCTICKDALQLRFGPKCEGAPGKDCKHCQGVIDAYKDCPTTAPAPAPAAPAPGPSGLGSDGSESSGITTTFSLATIAAAFIAIAALL